MGLDNRRMAGYFGGKVPCWRHLSTTHRTIQSKSNLKQHCSTMEDLKGTPESDLSIECFQNYTAPEVFVQGLAGIVDQSDVETMIRAQKQMLQRFEKTNEMLKNCNTLSANRLKTVGPDFKKHINTLLEMKRDLDYVFKKIRAIKQKLSVQHAEAFAEAARSSYAEECVEDEETTKLNRLSLNLKTDAEEPIRRASK